MAGLASLVGGPSAGGGFLQHEGAYCYIWALDQNGSIDSNLSRSFQFWPAEVTDNEGINYATKQIPGGNLPFYQWVSGGEHHISFTAVFARDLWANDIYAASGSDTPGIRSVSGDSGTPVLPSLEDKHTVDVGAAVKWLRQLKAPTYDGKKDFTIPPPVLRLVMPGTPIGRDMGDTMPCLMTQCDVTWKRWFPDGTPRLAEVALAFAETIQGGATGASTLKFYGKETFRTANSRYGFKNGMNGPGSGPGH